MELGENTALTCKKYDSLWVKRVGPINQMMKVADGSRC